MAAFGMGSAGAYGNNPMTGLARAQNAGRVNLPARIGARPPAGPGIQGTRTNFPASVSWPAIGRQQNINRTNFPARVPGTINPALIQQLQRATAMYPVIPPVPADPVADLLAQLGIMR
jgi:hypothetical protein